ncbi:Dihydropteroate synthase [Croceitalea dokdonensis DOKDO 023]|uniref:Dihydropteroate synthase n=1 Tax=Croceitalea dokdonensis DOKDO 023 TaxID=1300341 RepID=A0A0P7ANL9_9FLAO|nr:dihydropteroate synthase [Croceitalea dokdonensis]KPM30655.1 Dihydropteroate synthase [Croceitalea dokdonensis DOKDO 023]
MTINCNGTLIDLSQPKILGVLNITPDSFYDGGKYKDPKSILQQTERMLADGASFIDIGAYSSRPGAEHVPLDEELHRILPIVHLVLKEFPHAVLSIDTFRHQVAKKCLELGAAIINDISAGNLDPKMMETVAKFQVPYIMMHMKGTPQTMKTMDGYTDLIKDLRYYFSEKVALARGHKINDIILDPGFGFAKNTGQNFQLLAHLDLFKSLNLPLLAGVSRKSMIYKTLGTSPKQALNGTTALHMIALQKGASILRVHDVREAKECILLYQELKANEIDFRKD